MNALELSLVFSRIVRETFDGSTLKKINARNKRNGGDSCATHEFCDANMLMIEACAEVLKVKQDDVDLDANIEIINEAWSLAKQNRFMNPQGQQQ